MKYLLLICLVFAGCTFDYSYNPCKGMNEEEILTWIKNNMSYKINTFWQTPESILSTMSGDCEDWVILYMYLIYQNTGKKYDMGAVKNYKNLHAICIDGNNNVINVQGDSVFTISDVFMITPYDSIMFVLGEL